MTVELTYYVTFGPGDGSEWMDWEEELTPEEEAAYLKARKEGLDFNEVPELSDVISRAYDQIYEEEAENCEELFLDEDEEEHFSTGGWTLNVFFPDNDYDEEEEEDDENDDDEIDYYDYCDYPFAMETWNSEIISFKENCKAEVLQTLQNKLQMSLAEIGAYLARLYEDEDEEQCDAYEHLDILENPGTDFWEDVFGFNPVEKTFRLSDTDFLASGFGGGVWDLLEALEISYEENIHYGPHGHGTYGVIYIEEK